MRQVRGVSLQVRGVSTPPIDRESMREGRGLVAGKVGDWWPPTIGRGLVAGEAPPRLHCAGARPPAGEAPPLPKRRGEAGPLLVKGGEAVIRRGGPASEALGEALLLRQ
jgi:hypothetical protein